MNPPSEEGDRGSARLKCRRHTHMTCDDLRWRLHSQIAGPWDRAQRHSSLHSERLVLACACHTFPMRGGMFAQWSLTRDTKESALDWSKVGSVDTSGAVGVSRVTVDRGVMIGVEHSSSATAGETSRACLVMLTSESKMSVGVSRREQIGRVSLTVVEDLRCCSSQGCPLSFVCHARKRRGLPARHHTHRRC